MNERERAQVERIVALELKAGCATIRERTETIYRAQNAKATLKYGETALAIIEEWRKVADGLAGTLHVQVRRVASDREAFEAVSRGVLAYLDACAEEIPFLIDTLHGRITKSFNAEVLKRLGALRQDIRAKLDIAAYDYEAPNVAANASPSAPVVNRGGRPRAPFWEAMWAAIAAKLINGDLDPKTQADIERAMAEWVTANNHEATESTIRERARSLWRLLR